MDTKRRAGLFLLQIVVSSGLLAYLFWRINDDEGHTSLRSSILDWSTAKSLWLIGAIVLTFLSFVVATLRWQSAIDALGMKESFRKLFSHFMAGQFTSNFLPTTIGGDILRIARLNKTVKDAPNSFVTVVIDRLGGWIALPIICLLGLGFNSGLRRLGAPTSTALIVALATFAALLVVIYSVSFEATGHWLGRRQGVLRYMHALHVGFVCLKISPETLSIWWLRSFVSVCLVLAVGCAVEAWV